MIEAVKHTVEDFVTDRPVRRDLGQPTRGQYEHRYTGSQPLQWPEANIDSTEHDEAMQTMDRVAEVVPPPDNGNRTTVSRLLGRVASRLVGRSKAVEEIIEKRGRLVTVTEDERVTLSPDAPDRDLKRLARYRGKSDKLNLQERDTLAYRGKLMTRSDSIGGLTDIKQGGKETYYQRTVNSLDRLKEPSIRGGTFHTDNGRSYPYIWNEPPLVRIDKINMTPDHIRQAEAENARRLKAAEEAAMKKIKAAIERQGPYASADNDNPIDARVDPFDPDVMHTYNGKMLEVENDLAQKVDDGVLTQAEADLRREVAKETEIRRIVDDGEATEILRRLINNHADPSLDRLVEQEEKGDIDPEQAQVARYKILEDRRKLLLDDTDLHAELQAKVASGDMRAIDAAREEHRIKQTREDLMRDAFDTIKEDIVRYERLLGEGNDVREDFLSRYEKPLPDLDKPDEAIKRINENSYDPAARKNEAKQLRKWIRAHRKVWRLHKKRVEIIEGTDRTGKRLKRKAAVRANAARGLYKAQEGTDKAQEKARELRQKAKDAAWEKIQQAQRKYHNFKEGELNIPSIRGLDLSREAASKAANPRGPSTPNVLPRTSRRGEAVKAVRRKTGEAARETKDFTVRKAGEAKQKAKNLKEGKLDIPEVENLDINKDGRIPPRNPDFLKPRDPADIIPGANVLPRTNRGGEAVAKAKARLREESAKRALQMRQKAIEARRKLKRVKAGELDIPEIERLDLKSK